jgi:hypothetical protein
VKPIRIQRKRTKGWRMPPNTVAVSRPSRWGNPYTVAEFGLALAMTLFERSAHGYWSPDGIPNDKIDAAYAAHVAFRKRFDRHPMEAAQRDLRGKNLADFCPLDQPCHADIWLEIANK